MEEKRGGGAVDVKLMSLDSFDAAQQRDWSSVCVHCVCVCELAALNQAQVVGSARVKATSQTLHHCQSHIPSCARQGEQFVLA